MTTDCPESKLDEAKTVDHVKTSEIAKAVAEVAKQANEKEKPSAAADDDEEKENVGGEDEAHDPYYPPIVSLPEVEVKTGEDGEVEIFKRRAKLYRFGVLNFSKYFWHSSIIFYTKAEYLLSLMMYVGIVVRGPLFNANVRKLRSLSFEQT